MTYFTRYTGCSPYLRAKLQDYYESLGGGIDTEELDEDMGSVPRPAVTHDVRHYCAMSGAIATDKCFREDL